jgi:hypothetical protein
MVNATSGELVRMLSRRDDDGDDSVIPDVTPSFLRTLYNLKTDAYVPATMGQNALGILGLRNEYPSQEDP